MRKIHTSWGLTAVLLAVGLTVGCQFPGASPLEPRVVVSVDTVKLAPNADLGIVLDFRELLGMGYKVQQTGAGPISTISAKVTGPNIVGEVVASVDTFSCPTGTATLNFTSLPPGPVDVTINAFDQQGNVVAWAKSSRKVTITPNTTQQITLVCSQSTGGLAITFDCPGGCGSSPNPTPSASPTPTPSPFRILAGTTHYSRARFHNAQTFAMTSQYAGFNSTTPEGVPAVSPTLTPDGKAVFDVFTYPVQDPREYLWQIGNVRNDWMQREFGDTYQVSKIFIQAAYIGNYRDHYIDVYTIKLRNPRTGQWETVAPLQNVRFGHPTPADHNDYEQIFDPPVAASGLRLEVHDSITGDFVTRELAVFGYQ